MIERWGSIEIEIEGIHPGMGQNCQQYACGLGAQWGKGEKNTSYGARTRDRPVPLSY